jgi:glutamate 5-kinase
MTEGSLYKPFCDFEKYGLDYDYISNSYLQECENDIRKLLNRVFKIHCDFEKDDIVHVADVQGNIIGVGRTAYDSMEARQAIGQHDRRPIVHYEYLCIV